MVFIRPPLLLRYSSQFKWSSQGQKGAFHTPDITDTRGFLRKHRGDSLNQQKSVDFNVNLFKKHVFFIKFISLFLNSRTNCRRPAGNIDGRKGWFKDEKRFFRPDGDGDGGIPRYWKRNCPPVRRQRCPGCGTFS